MGTSTGTTEKRATKSAPAKKTAAARGRAAGNTAVLDLDADRGRREEVEAWLEGWHVSWSHLGKVPVSEFDFERSLRNQARLGDPVDQEYVDRYAEAMRAGAEFPAVTVWQAKDGRYVIIDGNHRLIAAREAHYELAVYLVSARPQTITAMTFEANVRHGKATSEEERVHHALYLIDNGMPKREAAQRMSVGVNKINKASLNIDALRRADGAGINRKDWESLPEASRNRLSMLHTDEALAAAVKLVIDAGLQTTDVFDLVSMVNDSRSSTRQLAIIKAQRAAYSERIQDVMTGSAPRKGKRVRSPKAALAISLGQTLSMPEPSIIVDTLGPAEREEYLPKVSAAIKSLTALRTALKA